MKFEKITGSMNSFELVSLIIPCYNAESTIEKCLESVISQTYRNLEIIIINDGSTDRSPAIIKQFQERDSRIILIDQINSGVSKARNQGIKQASGTYICFVDSDDWAEENYCSVLHQAIVENQADISIAEAFFEDKNGDQVGKHQISTDPIAIYDKHTALKLLLEDKIIQSHPWAKLYRAELLKTITFPENLEAFEDYFTMFKVFNNAKKVVKMNNPIYHYVQFENSLSHNLTPKRAYHFFLALMEAYTFLKAQNFESKFHTSIIRNILKKSFMVLKRVIRNTKADEMLSEKQNMRNGLKCFLLYPALKVGLENYLYLRFFVYYPEKYSRFIKK